MSEPRAVGPADQTDEQQPAESERPADPETEAPEVRQPQAGKPTVAADVDQVDELDEADEADEADDSILDAPWILAGLTGGGGLRACGTAERFVVQPLAARWMFGRLRTGESNA